MASTSPMRLRTGDAMGMTGAKKFIAGFFTAFVALGVIGFVVVWSGVINVSALGGGGVVDRFLHYSAGRSIARHASSVENPFAGDREAIRVGLAHFKANCLLCHGAPDVKRPEFALGLNPAPPDLATPAIQALSDGELFWVVANGLRGTGMPAFTPTHGEDEIRKIVAFLRHLPDLSPDELNELKGATVDESHHHEGQGH